ncbi:class I SAM-dependent methyltransferase [Streptomyces sp. NPDC059506]|uniref:class I SAM-dependent methyltransferase n=1 Tax=unclassified Streptomyces TaxID=2593676 RepID=UPI000CBEB4B7|nr:MULTISPECIES: class I SAM-dependent methyltransferase [unclassified Streptomyces]MCZ2525268.1 class I SAM-dependent methyltransferase [Streptomyces sp. HB2AG]PLW72402.1 SAM-dependent methyltransferase [Streptomyces sp. DJ]QMV24463.1 methyltransferase domain-containing protein [Streptomyces sp. SCUT-3]
MPVPHDIAAETELWDAYAESAFTEDAEPVFRWTQYAGHGPGPELLGEPRSVLEIGCGTGRALAYLARRGITARGVDLSPIMVKKTAERWADTGAEFVRGEVLEYLADRRDRFDAVYSVFGAAWFTDPSRLFPLVRARLNPGGVFVFSQPPAIPGAYGPQGMYKGGFAGRAMFTYRYSYRPAVWERLLTSAGFASASARVVDAPREGHIGTLIVQARAD